MKRIALIGLENSGKSVFLTSFYKNLEDKIQKGSELGGKKEYERVVRLDEDKIPLISLFTKRGKPVPFDVNENMESLKRNRWADKTLKPQYVSFELFKKTGNISGKIPLVNTSLSWCKSRKYTIYDFPGERLRDTLIYKFSDYVSWSKYMFDEIFSGKAYSGYRELSGAYVELFRDGNVGKERILSEYKKLLYNTYLNGRGGIISPSSFLLSTDGKRKTGKMGNLDGVGTVCGLDEKAEFAPIPPDFMTVNRNLFLEFFSNYVEYRERFVLPTFSIIESVDEMVVLVDITNVYCGGYPKFKATTEMLENISLACESSFLNPWRVKKVLFIATQTDRIPEATRDNVLPLLKSLTTSFENKLSRYNPLKIEYRTCSACNSTFPADNNNLNNVKGYRMVDGKPKACQYEGGFKLPYYWPRNESSDWGKDLPTFLPYVVDGKPPRFFEFDNIAKDILFNIKQ